MAKKQEIDSNVAEIKKGIEEDKAIIGANNAIKSITNGKISKIFITRNCPESVINDIEHFKNIASFNMKKLKQSNTELGVICKKPYVISVIALKK